MVFQQQTSRHCTNNRIKNGPNEKAAVEHGESQQQPKQKIKDSYDIDLLQKSLLYRSYENGKDWEKKENNDKRHSLLSRKQE